jgi:hypothetical protein
MENEFADLSQLQINPEDMAVVIKAKQTKRQRRKKLGRYAVVPMAWVHRMLGCRSPAAWQLMIVIAHFARMRKGSFQLTNEIVHMDRKAKSEALHIVENRLKGCILVNRHGCGRAPTINIIRE